MNNDFKVSKNGTVLMITLGRDLITSNAPVLQEELAKFMGETIEKVVFDASELMALSSSGLRVVYFAKQRLGNKPEIVFVNCAKEIYEVFEITGLFRFVSFLEDNRIKERKEKAAAGDKLQKKLSEIRQEELDHFAANNDVVCYQMKLGSEEE